MKTKTMTNVILMVLTLAFGMRPRELARRQSGSSNATRLLRASVSGTLVEVAGLYWGAFMSL